MYEYINGIVDMIESDYIVIDSCGSGYKIYTCNPYYFSIGKEYKVYLHQQIREDENTLYGFKTKEERNLFLKLIDVKGLGCKMALPMFATGNISDIVNAIEVGDIDYLKKFPKIGEKLARQIILDLKGKLVSSGDDCVNNQELIDTLKALGYKLSDINKVLPNIKQVKLEDQVKEALKLLLR